jgi:hypothetical protein
VPSRIVQRLTKTSSSLLHVNAARRTRAFSRHQLPELDLITSPSEIERAQGMPGAGLAHGPRATKKHAAEPQVQPNIRHSLRDGFTIYT